ncbi:uncharacterized protein VK521_015485 [Ammospiza maritima maritima]
MPAPCRPPSILRCVQALSALLALALAAAPGYWNPGEGDGCLSAWALSFVFTTLLLLNDAFRRPPPRRDLPLALACAAAMACAHQPPSCGRWATSGDTRAATAAPRPPRRRHGRLGRRHAGLRRRGGPRPSATRRGRPLPGHSLGAAQGGRSLPRPPPPRAVGRAGRGVGAGGFALVSGHFLRVLRAGGAAGRGVPAGLGVVRVDEGPRGDALGLGDLCGLGVVAYGATTVLWSLYSFSDDMGGQSRRPYGCPATCPWDRRVLVAVLSGLNLVAFGVDLGQTGRLVLLRA